MENEKKIIVTFNKSGLMRYISHLDFIRLIYRTLRRTQLPYCLSCGFNCRPKIKFGQALKLGVEGDMKTTFYFTEKIDLEKFKEYFKKQLVTGIRMVDITYG